MNSVKKFISENKVLSIIFIVIIGIAISFFIIDFINDRKIYQSDLYNNEEVPYINKKYEDNEYKVVTISDEDIARHYYRDFIKMVVTNPEEAWKVTIQDGDEETIDFKEDYKVFKSYVDKMVTKKTISNDIVRYHYKKGNSYNIITVVDSENYMYEIYEYGIWNYKVGFRGNIR